MKAALRFGLLFAATIAIWMLLSFIVMQFARMEGWHVVVLLLISIGAVVGLTRTVLKRPGNGSRASQR